MGDYSQENEETRPGAEYRDTGKEGGQDRVLGDLAFRSQKRSLGDKR